MKTYCNIEFQENKLYNSGKSAREQNYKEFNKIKNSEVDLLDKPDNFTIEFHY